MSKSASKSASKSKSASTSKSLNTLDLTGYDTILLDRDGTINRQIVGDYVRCWNQFEFLPGVLEALARFSKTAKHIFIVTNQRGIGRGLMTEAQLHDIHARMLDEVRAHDGRIDGIYYSTGIDDTDICRKPNTGMWMRIKADYDDVTEDTTVMIGDSDCDMEFANNCGIKGVLLEKVTTL